MNMNVVFEPDRHGEHAFEQSKKREVRKSV